MGPTPACPRDASGRALAFVAALWLVAVVVAIKPLFDYKGRAAAAIVAPTRWPERSAIARDTTRSTLLVLIHPRCACTQASISELARLEAQLGNRAQITALVVVPKGAAPDFAATTAVDRLQHIPGLRLVRDDGGAEARRFGVSTSGHVLLYDPAGALRYSGGITPARGHEGDSIGRRSILDLVTGTGDALAKGPVFGCPLLGANQHAPARERP